MKFLVDRCIGARLSAWLTEQGHDSLYAPQLGPDPGDEILLRWAHEQNRILITIDKDFGALMYVHNQPHAGMIRMPDVPVARRW
jgi:predicted nuclease of predicted toxin-antitoxin system